jgi:YVTN family beta-propeller protein
VEDSDVNGFRANTALLLGLIFGLTGFAADGAGEPIPAGAAVPTTASAPLGHPYRVFVTNESSGDMTVIDGATGHVIATWPLGKRPRGVAASPDGHHLYVALSGSPLAGPGTDERSLPPADKTADGIGIVDTASGRLETVLRGVSDPEQVAVSPDGSRLYVASEDTGRAVILHSRTGARLAELDVGGQPEGVAVSPDGRFAYVTSEEAGTVGVVNTQSLRLVARLAVGTRPRDVAFAPDGAVALVTGEVDRSVTMIDARAHRVLRRVAIPLPEARPKGAVVSPDGMRVYITTGRGAQVIALDGESLDLYGSVTVGGRPWGIALSPGGERLYTANGPTDDVTVVDSKTLAVMMRIPVGKHPWGLAVAP